MNSEEHLPLTETTLYILLSLVPGSKHGYAIMKEVEALSDGRVSLSTGTLYGALKRLLDGGWIERLDNTASDGNGRERKAYRLTELGQRIMAAEVARLQKVVATAQQRRIGVEP
jgi:DNA-binding PadR family transcriptional regulator